jgi:hypothetical protein
VIRLTLPALIAPQFQHQQDARSRITIMSHSHLTHHSIESATPREKAAAMLMDVSGLLFWTALIVMPIIAQISLLSSN